MSDDPGFWGRLLSWIVGTLAALIAVVYGDLKYAQRRLETKMDAKADKDEVRNKADKDEMTTQRDNIAALFEGQVEIRREIQQAGEKLIAQMHTMHVDILDRIDERKQRR